jgi:hypothetical protein
MLATALASTATIACCTASRALLRRRRDFENEGRILNELKTKLMHDAGTDDYAALLQRPGSSELQIAILRYALVDIKVNAPASCNFSFRLC